MQYGDHVKTFFCFDAVRNLFVDNIYNKCVSQQAQSGDRYVWTTVYNMNNIRLQNKYHFFIVHVLPNFYLICIL